jgi:hypothetical protein
LEHLEHASGGDNQSKKPQCGRAGNEWNQHCQAAEAQHQQRTPNVPGCTTQTYATTGIGRTISGHESLYKKTWVALGQPPFSMTRKVLSKMVPLAGRPTASCPSGGVVQSYIPRRHRLMEPPEAFRKRDGHLGIPITD